MSNTISDEELKALLGNDADSETLTEEEKDAVGEISNICMGTAATTLFTLVNNKVTITTPVVSYATWDDLINDYDRPCVFIQISYKEGIEGNNILILKEQDVKIITDLMMGNDGTNVVAELSELHLSAISEAMNQMMGSAATSLSSMLSKKIDISPPIASLIDLNGTIEDDNLSNFLSDTFIKVSFKMEIGNLVDSQIMQLYPIGFAKSLYTMFYQSQNDTQPEVEEAQQAQPPQQTSPDMSSTNSQSQPVQPQMNYGQPAQPQMGYGQPLQPQMGYGQPVQPQMNYGQPMQNMNAQPVQFQEFNNTAINMSQPENIDLIIDVPLDVTVELGRTTKSIKEILEFQPGTIIELNRLAGEPIDIMVNGKFVAKGEVVVIEENFGIRITEIIK